MIRLPDRARSDAAWSCAALGTVLVVMAALMLGDHHYFWYGDTPAAYYGWWYHLGDLVRHGHWTTLDPHAWRAGNFAAEGQWGLWSPLTVAIGLVASVSANLLLVTSAVKVGFALLGALGTFRLARSYDVPPALAYVAGVLAPMGGMTQYLDLPSWVAGEMIWALFPWVWWALRRLIRTGANPLPALVLGYLLVSVGYVFGTIMLVIAVVACLVDCGLARDVRAFRRVLLAGALLGLVSLTVYLPGVLTASVTARGTGFGGFGGRFTTDPVALLAGVLPTASAGHHPDHLFPYTYSLWLLPVALWLDWGRLRRGWRPLAGLTLYAATVLLIVDGPASLGPLRWPLRLEPFLVQGIAVLLVVAWHRAGLRPTRGRLAWSLAWVVVAWGVATLRASSEWRAHVVAVLLVGGGLTLVWWLVRRGSLARVAAAAGAVTLAAFGLQHLVYPTPPSPQRHQPTDVAAYRATLPAAVGDVLQVGATDQLLQEVPQAARSILIGSGWYLGHHHVLNTYTAVSQRAFKDRYCITYQGDTCPQMLHTLFTREPTTGRLRVDLLGVSSLLLVRRDFPASRLAHPPTGWQVADRTPYAVLWTRVRPLTGAGSVAWTSPGTSVSGVDIRTRGTSFRVDRVPGAGGTVVLSLLDWPGYATDVGSLADPVDGYLVTVHLPASAAGRTVHVSFQPPGWWLEVGAWVLALVLGAGWSVAHGWSRRRAGTTADLRREQPQNVPS